MSKLHVWVDLIVFPLGKVMVIGLFAGRMFVAGAFSTKKCPVAPESEMACLTDLVTRWASKIVAACGVSRRLFACTIAFHAAERVGNLTWVGWMILFVGGMYPHSSSVSSSLVMASVVRVHSSSLSSQLLTQTVSSSAQSFFIRAVCSVTGLLIRVGYSMG